MMERGQGSRRACRGGDAAAFVMVSQGFPMLRDYRARIADFETWTSPAIPVVR